MYIHSSKSIVHGLQLWDRADTSFLALKSPLSEIKVHLEIRFNFRSVLLDFQSFNEKPVFLVPFCSSYDVIYIVSVKNSICCIVSVVCKLAIK